MAGKPMGVGGILGGNLGVHIIKFPSGKFGFVGSLPASLGTPTKANTSDIMGGRAYRDDQTGESMVIKFPSFNTAAEAVAHAKAHGVTAKLSEGFNPVKAPAPKTKAPYSTKGMPNNWQAGFGPGSELQIAGGGSEVPFLKNGRWVLYVWEPKSGRKGLYDYGTDIVDWDNTQMENTTQKTAALVESVQKRDFISSNEAFAGLMREKVESALAKIRPNVKMNEDYNGWKNRQTWNVALWIGNDEGLYNMAKECAKSDTPYDDFVSYLEGMGGKIAHKTPDGVSWNDSGLDIDALDDMIRELVESKNHKRARIISEGESFGVECMECGKQFKTKSMNPSCPKCKGSDIDMPGPKKDK